MDLRVLLLNNYILATKLFNLSFSELHIRLTYSTHHNTITKAKFYLIFHIICQYLLSSNDSKNLPLIVFKIYTLFLCSLTIDKQFS